MFRGIATYYGATYDVKSCRIWWITIQGVVYDVREVESKVEEAACCPMFQKKETNDILNIKTRL